MNIQIILPWALFAVSWFVCMLTLMHWRRSIEDFCKLNDEWFTLAKNQEKHIEKLQDELNQKP